MAKIFRINPDYDCPPIWDEYAADYLEPSDLPLTASLISRMNAWQAEFDALLDTEDGRRSGFKSKSARVKFDLRGMRLARFLQTELGAEYEVYYRNQPVREMVVV
ncbi:MAG: hypothetical protein OHK0012_11100 [Synechococcales cyanobacterium]